MSETLATTEATTPPSGCLTPHHVWTKGCERCEHSPPPQIYDAAIKSLRHATIDDLGDDDGNAYPLIDMLSDAGKSVATGIARAEQIACDAAFDIWPTIKAYAAEIAASKDAEITTLQSRVEELEKGLRELLAASDPFRKARGGDGELNARAKAVRLLQPEARTTLEASDRNGDGK